MATKDAEKIREAVRARYAEAARARETPCCGPVCTTEGVFGRSLYGEDDAEALPETALATSFGCGNPTLLAELRPGEVVLDLGSGGGIDVLLSARRVAPDGIAYGLDMTPEMLALARRNQAEAGVANAEFLEGTIEAVPLPDESVDVIISNCVVNLSADKPAVFREAFRVLRPGGRLAIADVVMRRELAAPLQHVMGLWTGCLAGALLEGDYRRELGDAGFEEIGIEPTNVYDRAGIVRMAEEVSASAELPGGMDLEEAVAELDGTVMSAFIRARRPGR
ncbi:MAG: arsenite methyltransferase [Acidimicrobiales bacterium]